MEVYPSYICYWFLIPLWSEKILCVILVLSNLLRFYDSAYMVYLGEHSVSTWKEVLGTEPRTSCILSILYHWAITPTPYIYFVFIWSVLKTSVRSCCLMILFTFSVSLLIFCRMVLSIPERRVLKYPAVVVYVYFSFQFLDFVFCIMKFCC